MRRYRSPRTCVTLFAEIKLTHGFVNVTNGCNLAACATTPPNLRLWCYMSPLKVLHLSDFLRETFPYANMLPFLALHRFPQDSALVFAQHMLFTPPPEIFQSLCLRPPPPNLVDHRLVLPHSIYPLSPAVPAPNQDTGPGYRSPSCICMTARAMCGDDYKSP